MEWVLSSSPEDINRVRSISNILVIEHLTVLFSMTTRSGPDQDTLIVRTMPHTLIVTTNLTLSSLSSLILSSLSSLSSLKFIKFPKFPKFPDPKPHIRCGLTLI